MLDGQLTALSDPPERTRWSACRECVGLDVVGDDAVGSDNATLSDTDAARDDTTVPPSQQLSPIVVGPLLWNPCHVIGLSGSSSRWLESLHEAAVGKHAMVTDLDSVLSGDHHAEVQERSRSDPHTGATGRRDPDIGLEERAGTDLQERFPPEAPRAHCRGSASARTPRCA